MIGQTKHMYNLYISLLDWLRVRTTCTVTPALAICMRSREPRPMPHSGSRRTV